MNKKKKNRRGTRFFFNWSARNNIKWQIIVSNDPTNKKEIKLATFFSRDFWHLDEIDQMDRHFTTRHAESISRFETPLFFPVTRRLVPPTFQLWIIDSSLVVREFRLTRVHLARVLTLCTRETYAYAANVCDRYVHSMWIRYPRDLIASLCLDEAVSGIELSDSCVSRCNWLLPCVRTSFLSHCSSYTDMRFFSFC